MTSEIKSLKDYIGKLEKEYQQERAKLVANEAFMEGEEFDKQDNYFFGKLMAFTQIRQFIDENLTK